ncbi:GNAT family N-acetyltransferase [Rhodococcus triatomae]|uniref:FR47-like protein n=1 Tax=Rhodococcus triatomae TaxID=300028 RepID=A0A1G8M7C2_9NOCA|nr:GNAT family N-acetyltransferase [Rhodococcus triatomae]QNG18172.1 GNAT family N-acetyltransferase [Rhodococcus triatomae]QNG22158.1 GNAT family N-acetyltransferase [Rhodococcus triatomae]SDI63879.1 FR47-like protein [Rhodococcus triatomae]
MTADSTVDLDTSLHPLDDPVRASLRGAHSGFAQWVGRIGRYEPEVARFVGHPPVLADRDWADLATLIGPGAVTALRGPGHVPPDGWTVLEQFGSVQMEGRGLRVAGPEVGDEPEPEVLTAADVPEILDLVARTEPGPYAPRTIEMGTYLGLRVHGRLVALAGERMHPPGWTEISAVCTDPEFRGRGYASRLIRAVGAGIRSRGEVPFLHAVAHNTTAISLYETLGFTLRKRSMLTLVQTPA